MSNTHSFPARITIDMRSRFLFVFLVLALAAVGGTQISKGRLAPRDLPFTPPKKWALVIGASDYTELGKLNYAAKDAHAFADVLKERFDFKSEAIELITDDKDSASKPTVENVKKALDSQLADPRLNDGDLFIFYFSGHGIGTPRGDYLMPTDAGKDAADREGLDVKEITQRFVKAGLRNVLVIVDACRGGEKNRFGDDLRKLGRQANIAVLLGCEPGARSYEYPRLGHGAFTSFLIRSLKSAALQSETTGALWASRVAEDVGDRVREYTQRDYPDQPQTPTGWSEPTMDVLLGAFPRKGTARLKLADIIAETERLPKADITRHMLRLGEDLASSGRYLEAVEVYRTVDAVDRLSEAHRFVLSLWLSHLGKSLEMRNELARLSSGSDPLYAKLAILVDPSRSVRPEARVKAAKEIWATEPAEWVALLVWSTLQTHATTSDALEFIDQVLASTVGSDRLRLLLEGYRLAHTGKATEADLRWKEALQLPEAGVGDEVLHTAILVNLVNQGKTSETYSFLRQRVADPKNRRAFWHLMLAQHYKEIKKFDEMIDQLKAALRMKVADDELLLILRIAGLHFPPLAPQILEKADDYPFSWKAMLTRVWTTNLLKGSEAIQSAIEESVKFSDDEFSVLYECMKILDGQLEEMFDRGLIPAEKYSELMVSYSEIMAQNVDSFGYSAEAWLLFSKFALAAEKVEQAVVLFNRFLGPRLDEGRLPANLRGTYLLVALQMDDLKRAEQIWRGGGLLGLDQIDSQWIMSMYYATRGDFSKAKTLIPPTQPSEVFRLSAEAYMAYLDVKAQKKIDLAALAERCSGSPSAMHWLALTYAEQKQWDKAEPIMEEYAFQRQQGFFFLHARMLADYFNRLIANKEFERANQIAYNTAISGYGNPIYSTIHYGSIAEVSAFAGTIDLQVAEFDLLPDMDRGELQIEIDKQGNVVGKSVIAEKPRVIKGKVDRFGNLKATITEGNKSWQMTGKIAQPSLYKTLPNFKEGVQAFLLLDEKGQARYLIGRPRYD